MADLETITPTITGDWTFSSATIINAGQRYPITAQTDSTLTIDDADRVVVCDTTSNAIAITLPEAADNLGLHLIIFLETDGGNDVTVDCAGSDVFNSSSNTRATLADAEDYLEIVAVSDDRWLIVKDNSVAYSTP